MTISNSFFLIKILPKRKLYSYLEKVSWENIAEDFTPVCLDILNINRSVESIKNDSKLRRELNATIESCLAFLHLSINDNRQDFAMLLDFILYNNHFDIIDFETNREKTEEIFTQKRPYKTIGSRILTALKNPKSTNDYVEDPKKAFKNVENTLNQFKK